MVLLEGTLLVALLSLCAAGRTVLRILVEWRESIATTTLAAAMAGFYLSVPVGHVEAGLRTHDLQAPFPEEFNRQVASKLTKWHFAPTDFSQSNLLAERVPPRPKPRTRSYAACQMVVVAEESAAVAPAHLRRRW